MTYILSTGCQWRYLPKDHPPRSTVHDNLSLWNWDGTLDRAIHDDFPTGSRQHALLCFIGNAVVDSLAAFGRRSSGVRLDHTPIRLIHADT